MDLTSAAIATLISSGVASAVAYFLNRSQRLRTLNEQLDNILKISIQYPYLKIRNSLQPGSLIKIPMMSRIFDTRIIARWCLTLWNDCRSIIDSMPKNSNGI